MEHRFNKRKKNKTQLRCKAAAKLTLHVADVNWQWSLVEAQGRNEIEAAPHPRGGSLTFL